MDPNVIECDLAERDPGLCVCKEGPTLDILNEVQRAYEERLRRIDQIGGSKKLQMQVDLMRSWVSDLVGQNTLLARAVEELETEATTKIITERRKHSERDMKNIFGKVNELKTLNDSLLKENSAKDREIRKLNKDMQQYEQTILGLRKEISFANYHTPDISKQDAEVMAGTCCSGAEGDWQPVQDYNAVLREEVLRYQERIKKMEETLKSNGESVRALRKMNVSLSEEAHTVRRVCVALDEQCRAATMRANFKDDIIKEMRRQLKQAKAKLKEVSETHSLKTQKDCMSGDHEFPRGTESFESMTISCVRTQPRRKRDAAHEYPEIYSEDCRSPRMADNDSICIHPN